MTATPGNTHSYSSYHDGNASNIDSYTSYAGSHSSNHAIISAATTPTTAI